MRASKKQTASQKKEATLSQCDTCDAALIKTVWPRTVAARCIGARCGCLCVCVCVRACAYGLPEQLRYAIASTDASKFQKAAA